MIHLAHPHHFRQRGLALPKTVLEVEAEPMRRAVKSHARSGMRLSPIVEAKWALPCQLTMPNAGYGQAPAQPFEFRPRRGEPRRCQTRLALEPISYSSICRHPPVWASFLISHAAFLRHCRSPCCHGSFKGPKRPGGEAHAPPDQPNRPVNTNSVNPRSPVFAAARATCPGRGAMPPAASTTSARR
jgi:hypothetical protein